MLSKKEEILTYLQTIPKWKVVSYKFLAKKFWTHPRAVSIYMKYNKFPEMYPCYKVVKDNWDLSWYSWIWWINWKQKKLETEGIKIEKNKIKKDYFLI